MASSTPASAASGMRATSGAAASTITARTTAWVSAASLEPAPARTLTAVRAIAAVAGTPPNSGAARLASPCPNSSRSGSCRWLTLMPSATVADSRHSSAASAATASADGSSVPSAPRSRKPSDGAGRPAGSVPMRVRSAAAATCGDDRGGDDARAARTGSPGRQRAPTSITRGHAERRRRPAPGAGARRSGATASAATARTLSPVRRR